MNFIKATPSGPFQHQSYFHPLPIKKISVLKLETVGASETLTRNVYQNTRRHVPESCTINFTICSLCTCRPVPKLITKTATDTEV